MTGQPPPCAYQPATCGFDDEPGTCPCFDFDEAPPELWDDPPARTVTDVPTGSYL
ncbi:hypothetical protein [Streptomyces sp. NPDC096033]|uniref:hypothetical protein n=1 Tax=Streptomyces sp. NPDC096033 TaxID=3366071 RepID=UPI003810BBB6